MTGQRRLNHLGPKLDCGLVQVSEATFPGGFPLCGLLLAAWRALLGDLYVLLLPPPASRRVSLLSMKTDFSLPPPPHPLLLLLLLFTTNHILTDEIPELDTLLVSLAHKVSHCTHTINTTNPKMLCCYFDASIRKGHSLMDIIFQNPFIVVVLFFNVSLASEKC